MIEMRTNRGVALGCPLCGSDDVGRYDTEEDDNGSENGETE